MNKQSLFLLLTLSLATVGCSSNTETGAIVGSLVGAGIGKSTANHSDRRAAVGAVVGGIIGAAIGNEQDRVEAEASTAHTDTTVASSAKQYTTHTHDGSTHSHEVVPHSHETSSHYPVRTSIILGNGYNSYRRYPRRHYRSRGRSRIGVGFGYYH